MVEHNLSSLSLCSFTFSMAPSLHSSYSDTKIMFIRSEMTFKYVLKQLANLKSSEVSFLFWFFFLIKSVVGVGLLIFFKPIVHSKNLT